MNLTRSLHEKCFNQNHQVMNYLTAYFCLLIGITTSNSKGTTFYALLQPFFFLRKAVCAHLNLFYIKRSTKNDSILYGK